MKKRFAEFLIQKGVDQMWADSLSVLGIFLGSVLFGLLLAWIVKLFLNNLFRRLARNTKTQFDDLLIRNRVPTLLSYLPSLFFLLWIAEEFNEDGIYLGMQGVLVSN